MFVTNWNSTTKIQKISEITNFFRHYFLSRTEVENIQDYNRRISPKDIFITFGDNFITFGDNFITKGDNTRN